VSKQFWSETLAWATSSATAIAASTTETVLFPAITIPANYLQDGRVLRVKMYGGYGTTATPTLTFKVKFGSTVFAATGAIVTTSAVGGGASMTSLWTLEALMQIRTNGSAGTAHTNGEVTLYTSTVPTGGTVTNYGMSAALVSGSTGGSTPATASGDFTADTTFSVTATWGTNNAANSIQGHSYILEALN
jgi:hypothetical protein